MLSYTIKKENPTEGDISKARFSGTRLVQEKRWHIGQVVPLIPEGYVVVQVQADGDELEYLLDNFGNLPMAKTQVISWFGDMAMFIIHNMPIGMTWDKVNQKTVRIR